MQLCQKILNSKKFHRLASVLLITLIMSFSAVAQEITAIDFNGEAIGKVISDGKVISFENKIIGSVTADSLIIDNKGKIIGGVVPQGVAIGVDAKPLGKVGSDGTIRSASGQNIGKALPNGLVVNEYFEVLGQIIFPGLVYNDAGKIAGRITGDGSYSSINGSPIGVVTPDGYAYRKVGKEYVLDGRLISSRMVVSNSGDFIGSVVPGGQVTDFNSEVVGYIKANEFVYDNQNAIIGKVVNNGYAFGDNGEYLGFVSYNGMVVQDNKTIGRLRADGKVVGSNGVVIGFSKNFASVATDMQGRILGRLNPEGNIAKADKVVGRAGARGFVFDEAGNLIGRLATQGPIYDYKGDLIGHAVSNGSVISIDGSTIGYMIGKNAYNLSGTFIGMVLDEKMVILSTGEVVGMCGISSEISHQSAKFKVSPLGYVYTAKGELTGFTQGLDIFYSMVGNKYAYLGLSGQIVGIQGGNAGKLTGNGYVVDNTGKLMARNITISAAVNMEGNSLGLPNQYNELLNKSQKQSGKVLPDMSVSVYGNSNYTPKIGQAYSAKVAQKYNGEVIGYINELGQIINDRATKEGYLVERNLVSDNNGIIIGSVVDFGGARDKKCSSIGVMSSQGGIYNHRGVFVGRVLGNLQVINSGGAVIGAMNPNSPVINFDGRVIGYPDYNGKVHNEKGEYIGCLDFDQNLHNANGEWIGASAGYDSVIAFDDKIIGYSILDGQVVDDRNSVVGYQQPDGNVNSTSGLPIGVLLKYKVAFDFDNKFLGYINKQGKVVNNEHKGIGYIDHDGYVISNRDKIGYALNDFYVYDNENELKGIINQDGGVVDFNGQNLGTLDKGFVIKDNQPIARAARDYNIRDAKKMVIGYLSLDGVVVDRKGKKIGTIDNEGKLLGADGALLAQATDLQYYRKTILKKSNDEEAKEAQNLSDGRQAVLDENGNVIGYRMPDGTIVNEKGEIIGKVDADGNLYDAEGNKIGTIDKNGDVLDADGKVVGKQTSVNALAKTNQDIMSQLERNWYDRGKVSSADKSNIEQGEIILKDDRQYLKSLGIALTPDGEYLGDILENDEVVNDQGDVIGYRMPDGMIMDDDGNLIGTEENAEAQKELSQQKEDKKDVFIPSGTFGPGGAYGTGTGPAGNLGPGGGYGPGERYDPTRRAALNAAMQERRSNISVGKISSGIRKEAFDGYQKDWSEQGIPKSIVSWRVDMSEMIFSDKPIPAVIARAIDAANPAPVTAYVERNVYAEEGRNIIIPAGSRLIGSFGGISGPTEATSDAARVQISWERLIRPDGSIFIFSGQTADAQGRSGALGYSDQQLLKKYTLPALTTILTSSVAYLMATDDNSSGETETSKQQAASDARQNFLNDMQSLFDEILQDKTNVKAQVYIPNGTRIIIYPNTDLWLRSFENDKEESKAASGNFHGLIDKDVTETSANVQPGQPVYGPGAPTSTLGGGGSSVTYSPDNANVNAVESMSLIGGNQTGAKRVAPPPPPAYNNASGNYAPTTPQASSDDTGAVPSLF